MPHPTTFNPNAGTAIRVLQSAITPDLLQGFPNTGSPPATATLDGVIEWQFNPSLESGAVVHSESPGDSRGVVWKQKLQGGVASWKARLTGYVDTRSLVAATTGRLFPAGQFMVIDFLVNKTLAAGRYGAVVQVVGYTENPKVGPDPQTYTVEFDGHGAPPDFTFG